MSVATKIIFLDFDGPLSTSRTQFQTGNNLPFDPVAVQILNHICAASGAKIVCSSRRTWAQSRENFRETRMHFEKAGLDISNIHPDWSCRTDHGDRKDHIEGFLKKHPEVTHYAIVDDETVDLPGLVLVGEEDGILMKHFEAVAKHLDFDLGLAFYRAAVESRDLNHPLLPFGAYEIQFNNSIK
jgi:hypothetical protein